MSKTSQMSAVSSDSESLSDDSNSKTIRSFKIEFFLENQEDHKLFDRFIKIREMANDKKYGPKVRPGDLFKAGLKLLKDDDIRKIREARFTAEDQLKVWTDTYNKKNGTNFGPSEFAVQVLPGIKMRELRI